MVVLHPSRSKSNSTRSAEAFFDERIASIKAGEKPPKMQFWRLMLSIWFFLFLGKYSLLNISKEHIVQRARVPEIASSGTYTLHGMSSILFFRNNCIFHLNSVGTQQATIRNSITENSVARNPQ